jgi:hypothetical protein
MAPDTDRASRSRQSAAAAARAVDRLFVALCAAIWLVVLGVGVAAMVALVDMGHGHVSASTGSKTPWLLYTVIGVSALVIAAAIPLLLRARRTALADSAPSARPGPAPTRGTAGPAGRAGEAPVVPTRGPEAATEKLRVFGTIADPVDRRRPDYPSAAAAVPTGRTEMGPEEAVERVWLRCPVNIASAMGAALVAIGGATYAMAVEHDNPAWVGYGVAGLITVVMPFIPWYYLRQLRREMDAADFVA